MHNFINKHNRPPVDMNKHVAGVNGKDETAIKKIERLELELMQMHKVQSLMNDNAKNCAASLDAVHNRLLGLAASLIRSNQHISELTKENNALKSSGEEWFKRTIKLQFEVLSVKDGLKIIENERDLALKKIDRLQAELMLANKDNTPTKNQL